MNRARKQMTTLATGTPQEIRDGMGDDDQEDRHEGRGVPLELSEAHRAYVATINRDELPSVEEALARLSGVMQDSVEWIMAQEMAEAEAARAAARAARDTAAAWAETAPTPEEPTPAPTSTSPRRRATQTKRTAATADAAQGQPPARAERVMSTPATP